MHAVSATEPGDLVAAARGGDAALVAKLLSQGVNPDSFDNAHNTALIFAARDGRIDLARRLIEAGATVDWIDGEGVTPLILAAFKNHPAVVRYLLSRGAETGIRDQWGRVAMDYALRRGAHDPIASMLRRAAGD